MKPLFAIARNFQCKGSWGDRLLVAEGGDWRSPGNDELGRLTPDNPADNDAACCSLFSIPAHMSTRFWSMLNEEVSDGSGDFVEFSDDLVRFLDFKDMAAPDESVCELLIQEPGGTVQTADVWALVNFGDEPVVLAWEHVRLRLSPGEGARMAEGAPPEVMPPPTDELNVLLAIRIGHAGE